MFQSHWDFGLQILVESVFFRVYLNHIENLNSEQKNWEIIRKFDYI